MKQNYDNYYKAYYEKNKHKILQRRKEKSALAAKKYYQENKITILYDRKLKRQLKAKLLFETQVKNLPWK